MKLIARSIVLFLLFSPGSLLNARSSQNAAPTGIQALGAFLGKWESEGTFAAGQKVTAALECRWSPQKGWLICDQTVTMNGQQSRQLTAYTWNPADGAYSYTTVPGPGGRPATGGIEINGNTWTYLSRSEANGQTTQIRNTNVFTDARTETFKVERSTDGGQTWSPLLQGVAHKIGD